MHRSDKPASSTTYASAAPVPDVLADFQPEQHAPIRRAIAHPVPRPDIGRIKPAAVVSASATSSKKRGRLGWFASGVVCGAVLCLIVVSWLTTSELPRPAPALWELSDVPPAAEPSFVTGGEHRPPVIKTTSPAPAPQKTLPDARRVAVPPPRTEGTSAAFVGSLQIDSTPPGARVFIDRQPVGVTPLVLTDLVIGSHAIRIEADGHTPWSSAIRVIANRQTDVNTILSPSHENASPRP